MIKTHTIGVSAYCHLNKTVQIMKNKCAGVYVANAQFTIHHCSYFQIKLPLPHH